MIEWRHYDGQKDRHGALQLLCSIDADGATGYYIGRYNSVKRQWEDDSGRRLSFRYPYYVAKLDQVSAEARRSAIESERELRTAGIEEMRRESRFVFRGGKNSRM